MTYIVFPPLTYFVSLASCTIFFSFFLQNVMSQILIIIFLKFTRIFMAPVIYTSVCRVQYCSVLTTVTS